MKSLLFLLFLASCAPASWQDLRSEGEAETKKLAELLHEIDTKDELQKQLPKVKKSYEKIAELALEVRDRTDCPLNPEPSNESDALFAELARLYEMPGCRTLMESAQSDAIKKLK